MGPKVSVILINHNGSAIQDVISRSITAVQEQSFSNWELILVDDNSTDGSDRFLQSFANSTTIQFTRTEEGHSGVGAARNAGIRLAGGELLAFLDNDAIPMHDWLNRLVDKMDQDSSIGAVASLVLFHEKPDIVNSCGSVLNATAHGTAVGMHELVDTWRPIGEIMYATGNGMMIRGSALDRIGIFDEGYRFYGHDDSDIGIRLRNVGYKIVQEPAAVLLHLHSTSKRDPRMIFWDQRNRLRFALKHLHWRELFWFAQYDLLNHRNPRQLPRYLAMWTLSLNGSGSLWRYRWQNRHLDPFFVRFSPFFCGIGRYIKMPDNRAFGKEATILENDLVVGRNEEAYLYSGWYDKEQRNDDWVRWANPVSSLRVVFTKPIKFVHLKLALYRRLAPLTLSIQVKSWANQKIVTDTECKLERAEEIHELELPFELAPGEYRLILQASDHLIEDSFFPRKIAFGLLSLGVR